VGFTMTDGGGDNFPGKIGFKGYVVKNGSDLTVLSATCSHLGCSVAPNASGAKRFDCPCHGSQFSLTGAVTHGPAAADLSHYDWKRVDNNPSQIKVAGVSLPGVG
jgi:Rieske Fe-S protein